MIFVLKLTVSVIQGKLSWGTVSKVNIRTKQIEGNHQESPSNKSMKTKKSKTNQNQLKGSKANCVGKSTKLIMKGEQMYNM